MGCVIYAVEPVVPVGTMRQLGYVIMTMGIKQLRKQTCRWGCQRHVSKEGSILGGTKAGGRKARETNTQLYGADYYARIGAIGGKIGKTGGFAADIKCDKKDCDWLAVWGTDHLIRECAGARGGRISRRGTKA